MGTKNRDNRTMVKDNGDGDNREKRMTEWERIGRYG